MGGRVAGRDRGQLVFEDAFDREGKRERSIKVRLERDETNVNMSDPISQRERAREPYI